MRHAEAHVRCGPRARIRGLQSSVRREPHRGPAVATSFVVAWGARSPRCLAIGAEARYDRSVRVLFVAAVALVTFVAGAARADIYSYEDKEGVVHFTNVAPPKGGGHQWKVLYKTGPGKAGIISGAAG